MLTRLDAMTVGTLGLATWDSSCWVTEHPLTSDERSRCATHDAVAAWLFRKEMISIIQFSEWPDAAIRELIAESEQEGFRFVRRAFDEWHSGANRFSNPGEAIFGAFEGESLLAIGGINRELERGGRLRRFYVRRQARRQGVGRRLLHHILGFARSHYSCVALRCDTAAADGFYTALGFRRTISSPGATHMMEFNEASTQAPSPPSPGRSS